MSDLSSQWLASMLTYVLAKARDLPFHEQALHLIDRLQRLDLQFPKQRYSHAYKLQAGRSH